MAPTPSPTGPSSTPCSTSPAARPGSPSTEALVAETEARAWSAVRSGTTTLEAKSGYGLDTATEVRLLEVIATVAERTPLRIYPTFLGAHLLPEPGYLDLLVEEMLPACAPLA